MTALLRVAQNYQSPYDATSLPAHFAKASITPCVCAHIVAPIGGTVIGVTSWSQDITGVPGYPGVTFKSTTGMSASNVESQQGQAATNMEADLFLLTAGITEADALAGKWSHALTTIFVMNYEVPNMGQYILQKGYLGQFVQRGQMLSVEVMGFNQALTQTYGKVTRPECIHQFCDAGCTLNVATYTHTGTLTAVTDQTTFRDSSRSEADDSFGNGKITFTSGNNSGYSFHIDSYASATKQFILRTPTPYLPVIGDTYSAVIGCRKRHAEDCVTRFSNVINFGGFPWIPTQEEISRLPITS